MFKNARVAWPLLQFILEIEPCNYCGIYSKFGAFVVVNRSSKFRALYPESWKLIGMEVIKSCRN